MEIKIPISLDVSRWESIADWKLVKPKPALVIAKATEGTSWVDPTYASNIQGIRAAGIACGAFHYFSLNVDPVLQAQHFTNTIQALGVKTKDILAVDFEHENGGSATALITCLQIIKTNYPDNMVLLYSRKNILDSLVVTPEQAIFLKTIPIWTAGYPVNPDLYSSPPASYIPDQSKWGRVVMWQYSDKGVFEGIVGQVDVNWLSVEIQEWIGVPDDRFEYLLDGNALLQSGSRTSPRNFNFHVLRFFRQDVTRIHVNGLGFLGTGLYFWETRNHPDIVINGGHADYSVNPPIPLAVVVTDGDKQKTNTSEVSIQTNRNHLPIGMEWFANPACYNAVGVSDILLQGGVIPASVRLANLVQRIRTIVPFLDDTYVDPRSSLFWTDTEWLIVVIDGRNDGTLGLTRLELAEFVQTLVPPDELDQLFGGNLDGGDSCGLIVVDEDGNPVIRNNPPDNKLHSVANHVGFWVEHTAQPPEGGDMIPGVAQEKLGKTMTVRTEPGATPDSGTSETIGPHANFDWYRIVDDVQNPGDANYQWFALDEAGTRFVNYIYPPNGLRADIISEPTEPPPANPPRLFELKWPGYKPFTGTLEPEG